MSTLIIQDLTMLSTNELRSNLSDACKNFGYEEVKMPKGTYKFWYDKLKELNGGRMPAGFEKYERGGRGYNEAVKKAKGKYYYKRREVILQRKREAYHRNRQAKQLLLVQQKEQQDLAIQAIQAKEQ